MINWTPLQAPLASGRKSHPEDLGLWVAQPQAEISRRPSWLTPLAIIAATGTTRPPRAHFQMVASAAMTIRPQGPLQKRLHALVDVPAQGGPGLLVMPSCRAQTSPSTLRVDIRRSTLPG